MRTKLWHPVFVNIQPNFYSFQTGKELTLYQNYPFDSIFAKDINYGEFARKIGVMPSFLEN